MGRTNRTLGAVVFRGGAPISHVGRVKLRTWRQLGSVQDYTSGFLALCEQVGYIHEYERIDRYIGGPKHDIAQEIQLRCVTDFQEILAMAEKLDFFPRARPGSYGKSLLVRVNAITMKRAVAAGADVYAVDIREAEAGYHQVPLPDLVSRRIDRPIAHSQGFLENQPSRRSFEYTVLPFGLTNAPVTFQMTMNEAFRPLLDKCVIVYLDDILIYSTEEAQHLQDIEAVFKMLSENRLLTKASKCAFLQDRLEFLGHVISADGVEIDPKNIATIQAWHAPTNLTELQSFLGFVNYVRQFVPGMTKLTAPLTDLLRKGVEYTWGEKEQAAFLALKM
ncbi:unnamed protein product [Closterium sp. NIES-53]